MLNTIYMKIKSIKFKRGGLFRRRQVLVELSTGNTYKIKREGAYAVVLPPCQDGERSVLKHVYNAVWPWLESASDNAAAYDRGTKKAVAQVANFLEWPESFAGDGLDKYNWIAEHIQTGTDIN